MLGRQPYDATLRRSQALFHWRARDGGLLDSQEAGTGLLTPLRALTGQLGELGRDSAAVAIDGQGEPYTVPANVPAWRWAFQEPSVGVWPATGGRAADSLHFPLARLVSAHAGYLRYVDQGAAAASGYLLLWGSSVSTTGHGVHVQAAPDSITVTVRTPGGDVSASVGVEIQGGDRVEVQWSLAPDQVLSVSCLRMDDDVVEGATVQGSITLPFDPAASELHIGGRDGADVGGVDMEAVLLWPDYRLTLEEIRNINMPTALILFFLVEIAASLFQPTLNLSEATHVHVQTDDGIMVATIEEAASLTQPLQINRGDALIIQPRSV